LSIEVFLFLPLIPLVLAGDYLLRAVAKSKRWEGGIPTVPIADETRRFHVSPEMSPMRHILIKTLKFLRYLGCKSHPIMIEVHEKSLPIFFFFIIVTDINVAHLLSSHPQPHHFNRQTNVVTEVVWSSM
jgi:hypothetical protein